MEENSKPVLTPEQAKTLVDNGTLSQDIASKFLPEEVTTPEDQDVLPNPSGFSLQTTPESLQMDEERRSKEALERQKAVDEAAAIPFKRAGGTSMDLINSPVTSEQSSIDKLPVQDQRNLGVDIPMSPEEAASHGIENTKNATQAADFVNPKSPQDVSLQDRLQKIQGLQPDALDTQKSLLAKGAALGQAAANAESNFYNQQADLQRKNAIEDKQRLEAFEANADEKLKSLEDDFDSFKKDAKIDPNRFWDKQSTGFKIRAFLGILISGFGAGILGQKNAAIEHLDNMINQDISAQKFKHEKGLQALEQKKTLYSKMMDKFKNKEAAISATRAQSLQAAQLELQAIKAKFQGADAQNKADMAIAKLDAEKQKELMSLKQKLVMQQMMEHDPASINPADLSKEDRERFVPGMGLALSKKGAEEVRELKEITESVDSSVDELMTISSKGIGADTDLVLRGRAQTISDLLKAKLRVPIVGPGAVTEQERAILDKVVRNPTDIFSLSVMEKASLMALKDKIRESFRLKSKANGLSVGKHKLTTFKPEN